MWSKYIQPRGTLKLYGISLDIKILSNSELKVQATCILLSINFKIWDYLNDFKLYIKIKNIKKLKSYKKNKTSYFMGNG